MSRRSKFEDAPSDVLQRRFERDQLWSSSTLSRVPPEHYDPFFTPIFTSFFTSQFVATAAGSFATKAAIAIATTSVSIGLSELLQ